MNRPASHQLFPLTLDSFFALGHEARVRALSCLLDVCSHIDQLSLRKELDAHLARDFLTRLPPEIAVEILSYLPLESLLTGLQVCKGWKEVISRAIPCKRWKKVASELGLSDAIVESYLPKYGSYVDLILAALKHRKCISSYAPKLVTQKSAFQTNYKVAGHYIVCQTPCSSDGSTTVEIKRMNGDGSLVTLHSCSDPCSRLKLHFGPFAPANEFVCWGNHDTGWIVWDPQLALNSPASKRRRLKESEPAGSADADTGLHVWPTTEVTSYSKTAAVCPTCGIIAILVPLTSNQEGGVCVLFRRLIMSPSHSTINIGECILQLPRNLTVANVIGFGIFPRARESEHDVYVCSCHYLVAEYFVYPFITLHSMHMPAKASCHNDCVLSTVQIPTKLELSSPSTLYFCSDGSVVVIVKTFCAKRQYCIWEPVTGRVTGVHLASIGLNSGSKFRAIGKLYSVLGGQDGFAVVTTYTGEVLLSIRNLYCYSFTSPPVDQTWLSTLSLAIPEHIPIATLYSTAKTESSIATIIAHRCNRKCVD